MSLDRVGLSFHSTMSPDEVRAEYVGPLRAAIENARSGTYTDYIYTAGADPTKPAEHLLMFHVRDFEAGLRLLRTALEDLKPMAGAAFHNLNPSEPAY
jgi:hypothetical protein